MRINSIAHLLGNLILTAFIVVFITACQDDPPDPVKQGLEITFSHKVDGSDLVVNNMIYTNAAGNPYEVTEIMYFISDVKLFHQDGRVVNLDSWDDIHYVDTNIPTTFNWLVSNDVPSGIYDSLTFTFGISSTKNQSFMFVNPPEVNMSWPGVLGGGYHYLMLNGWWKDTVNVRRPFNFHFGIGQIYENNSGQVSDIIGFIDNSFTVTPAGNAFELKAGEITQLKLVMNVESWFDTPIVYDHNQWGGAIMQIQDAMHIGCMNGHDVFSLE
ncbi:MAG: hypothetical protein RBS07_01490 [Lentimicrobium sp.]|jgi:hypothetical protein|nr:hypothetical protein [Lentimicrobium sp.]